MDPQPNAAPPSGRSDSDARPLGGSFELRPPVLFRCPACRKLYSADPDDLAGGSAAFECVECRSEFTVAAEAAAADVPPLATLASEPELSRATRERVRALQENPPAKPGASFPFAGAAAELRGPLAPCPRCLKMNAASSQECVSCGVVFRKWRPHQDVESDVRVGGTRELGRLWDAALESWDDDRAHGEFVRACAEERRLAYAGMKYRRVLDANPGEDVAQKMLKRIDVLAAQTPRAGSLVSRALALDLRGLPRFLTSTAILLATALLGIGVFAPGLGSLAGVGALFLALAVALRVWLGGGK